jgi:N-acetylmuramoyl-L-alanine amidase
MTLLRPLVVSVTLLFTALPAGASTITLGGRAYVDAASLAARLGAKLERTPDRIYLRQPGHLVTLTRGWARVEIDGKPVVLEAPVRVERDQWFVPDTFMRQVMPLLEAPASVARASEPAARGSRVEPRAVEAPRSPAVPVRIIEAPKARAAEPKVVEPPRAPVAEMKIVEAPRVAGPVAKVIELPKNPAGAVTISEAPRADGPSVARAVEPARAASAAAAALKATVPGAALEDLRVRSYPTFTRVVLEMSGSVGHRVEVVTPTEVRIRLTSLGASRRAETLRDGLIEEVQLEPIEGDAVLRVTFAGASQVPKTSALSDPPRLIFDFTRPAEPMARPPAAGSTSLRTLVLDAGHGGHDSGAVGPAGLMEKDLVLDVTRRVAKLVEAHLHGIKVLLSRKGDYFVPLRDRTSFANRERADLFVSIHANAHREAASEGVETYFLSSEATDNAARQVAAAENSVVQLEKPSGRGSRGDVVKAILWDLAQSEFQQESSRLAEVVQDSMTQSLKIPNRGVKQAGFYVLGGAAMPAILVEIGFVTNPREERKLKDTKYRDEIAQAIFAGIAGYKQDVDRRPTRSVAR